MTAVIAEPVRQRRNRQRSAFGNLVRTEARLLIREVVPLLWGVGFPMVLLSIMGAFSRGPDKSLGGFSLVGSYEPILIGFTMATFALQGLPVVLAGYRERGILRRRGDRAALVEAGSKRNHSVARDTSVGRLESCNSAQSRGLTDGASGVGRGGQWNQTRSNRGGGATR